jgi:hypothetical protein
MVIRVWPKLLSGKKQIGNYYKFVNMNAMALQDLLISTFKNCSKVCDCFNPLSIKQMNENLKTSSKLKSLNFFKKCS